MQAEIILAFWNPWERSLISVRFIWPSFQEWTQDVSIQKNPRFFLAPETLMANFDTGFQAVEGEIFLSSVSIAFYLREILESFYWRSKLWEHNRKSLQHDSSDYFLLFCCCCCAHIATAGELTTPPRLQNRHYFVIQTSRNTWLPRRRRRRR